MTSRPVLFRIVLSTAVALALWGWIAHEAPTGNAPEAGNRPTLALQRELPASSVPPLGSIAAETQTGSADGSAQAPPAERSGADEETREVDSDPQNRRVVSTPLDVDALKAGDESAQAIYKGFLTRIEKEGSVPLIIGLSAPVARENSPVDPGEADRRRQMLTAVQDHLLSDLAGVATDGVKRFETIPYLALTVDAEGLAELVRSDPVLTVEEDVAVPPALLDSVPLIGGNTLHSRTHGYDGTGVTVAILDTGVDKTHPFLDGGKVVSEACYSTNRAAEGATSTCPGGVAESTAAGSGVACDNPDCDHGTWVAGIAAGKDGTGATGGTLQGVAPGASIIAIQVFTKYDSLIACYPNQKCVKSYTSDLLQGLERVYALRDTYKIAAANLSLGGGFAFTTCDRDASLTASIDNLRAVGIATVTSSGNVGVDGLTGSPACISSIIAVGASDKKDKLWQYSDHASWVDMIAPGVAIQSSVLDGAYEAGSGTSAAAPHVTGCFALYRDKYPSASVTTIEEALKASATVSISRSGIAKPRIDCYAAVMAPGATTPVSPRGLTSDVTPTYSWNAMAAATSYHLSVDRGASQVRDTWYTAKQAGCAAGSGTCRVTPGAVLESGAYSWRIQVRTPQATGPWSGKLNFSLNSAPGQPTLIPHLRYGRKTRDTTPTYRWNAVAAATSYRFSIYWREVGSNAITRIWYTAAEAGCAAGTGTCSVTPSIVLQGGLKSWWIRAQNRHGMGPRSQWDTFNVDDSPGAVTLISPQGATTDTTPTYRWKAAAGASQYYLWVGRGADQTIGIRYTAAEAGCAVGTGTCSVTPSQVLRNGAQNWWIRPRGGDGDAPRSERMKFVVRIPLEAPPLVSPQGAMTNTTPTYSWTAVAAATHYYLWVGRGSSKVIGTWYTAAQAGCAAGTGTCSVTPSAVLQNGTHSWWIQTWGSQGRGLWSTRMDFAIGAGFPEAATPSSPQGAATDTTPTYSWNAVATATHYYLWVGRGSGRVIGAWYTAAQAECAAGTGTCSVTPSTVLPIGAHAWWIQTWGSQGRGPWSVRMDFAVGANSLGAPTPIAPYPTTTDITPTYRWSAVATATSYYLGVDHLGGDQGFTTVAFGGWHTAQEAGCAAGTGTCSVTPSTVLQGGAYFWRVSAWKPHARSPSSGMEFTVRSAAVAATPVSPQGATTDTPPTYRWNAVAGAVSYRVSVDSGTDEVIGTWHTAAQAECAAGTGTCRVTPSTALQSGAYNWRVQIRNSEGVGPWSVRMKFAVGADGIPDAATANSPVGTTTDLTPTYSWTAVANVTFYRLRIDLRINRGSSEVIGTWYTAAQAGCAAGTGTCRITPSTTLQRGDHAWWIQTSNGHGDGPRSNEMRFTVSIPLGAATPISPRGATADATPTYTWSSVPNTTSYYLRVGRGSDKVIGVWYTEKQAGCATGRVICSITPGTDLQSGAHTWWVQAKNYDGRGPRSDTRNFTVSAGR